MYLSSANCIWQDLSKLKPSELTPLSPEVISRQATINIGTPLSCPLKLCSCFYELTQYLRDTAITICSNLGAPAKAAPSSDLHAIFSKLMSGLCRDHRTCGSWQVNSGESHQWRTDCPLQK